MVSTLEIIVQDVFLTSINPSSDIYKAGANGGNTNYTIGKWSMCGPADSGFNDLANNIIINPGYGVKLWTNCEFKSDNSNET